MINGSVGRQARSRPRKEVTVRNLCVAVLVRGFIELALGISTDARLRDIESKGLRFLIAGDVERLAECRRPREERERRKATESDRQLHLPPPFLAAGLSRF